jgi:alanine dehydrogenase
MGRKIGRSAPRARNAVQVPRRFGPSGNGRIVRAIAPRPRERRARRRGGWRRSSGRRAERAAEFARHAAERSPGLTVSHGTDARVAVEGADIICTLTNSPTPVLSGDWLEPGQHLNVVGASVASKREIDDAAVLRAAVYCDYLPSLLAQAGEVAAMVSAGTITQAHLRGEIGAVLLNRVQGRQRPDEITLYRSLGTVAQDLAVAHHVLAGAEAAGRGRS